MPANGPARPPDEEVERLIEGALPAGGGFSFFGGQKEQLPPPVTGIEPGRVIDDFRLVALIGQGGMGQVWEAEQVSLKRSVALKLVRPDRVNKHTLDLFSREARAGGRLHHSGIVAVHAHGESDGIAWIAMEYVQGSWTLRDFLDDAGRQELPQGYYQSVAHFVAELADAIQAAHAAGVIHRDLKPQNVLVTPDEHPKVGDFGLARITDETALSVTGDFAGTYAYMSPEQVAAKRIGLDHRTDVFSLGVVLYEMLVLQRPFTGDTSQQVGRQIMLEDPTDPRRLRSKVPRDLAVISGKCMEKHPDRRYQSMAELAADIRRHLANEPIVAKLPTAWQRGVKWVRRHPTKSVAAGISVVAFGVISYLLLALTGEIESVKRLSALQDYEDLLSLADKLWPVEPGRIEDYQDWIREGQELVEELPIHRRKRDELRSMALPRSDDECRADRESHEDFPKLATLEAKLGSLRVAQAQRRDGVKATVPEVDWSVLPKDAGGLNRAAWALVDPGRASFGEEGRGLVIAQRALALAEQAHDDEGYAGAQHVLSRALFALGRDGEALEASEIALDLIGDEKRAEYEKYLSDLKGLVAAATNKDGQLAVSAEIGVLESRLAALEERVSERTDWRFPPEEEQARWWNNQLTKLIGELEELADEKTGLLGEGISAEHGWGMDRRLAVARCLEEGFAEGGEYAVRWEEALPGIHEAYPGLDLPLQMGLVPIGVDPASGFWEFWNVTSGKEPLRGEDGKLVMEEGSGLVFVLLRGGNFWMGAQGRDPEGRNYDKDAFSYEGPVHEVEVSAFFLSKYEMTQGQWERQVGSNPSRWTAETYPSGLEGAHPVETMSWLDSVRVLGEMGLVLPSEAQWEYGCRAGTGTPQPFAFEEFATHANIADQTYGRVFTTSITPEVWDDGLGGHAPVGRLVPNGFGLYDTIGNVWEWCSDGYDSGFYGSSPPTDPMSPSLGSTTRVYRGGCFIITAIFARSAVRRDLAPPNADDVLGVRPARAITR